MIPESKLTIDQAIMLANAKVKSKIGIGLEGAPGVSKTGFGIALTQWRIDHKFLGTDQWGYTEIAMSRLKDQSQLAEFQLMSDANGNLCSGRALGKWAPAYRVDENGNKVLTMPSTMNLPFWKDENGKYEFHPAVVLCDELSAVPATVQNGLLGVILNKGIDGYSFHKDTQFIVAWNDAARCPDNYDIPSPLVGPNGRFYPYEMQYSVVAHLSYIQNVSNYSPFWKGFSQNYLAQLSIMDEKLKHDTCPRSWDDFMETLSENGITNEIGWETANGKSDEEKERFELAQFLYKTICFEQFGKDLAIAFKNAVKGAETFDAVSLLNGSKVMRTYGDLIQGLSCIISYMEINVGMGKEPLTETETKVWEKIILADYETPRRDGNGKKILVSKKEKLGIFRSNGGMSAELKKSNVMKMLRTLLK